MSKNFAKTKNCFIYSHKLKKKALKRVFVPVLKESKRLGQNI